MCAITAAATAATAAGTAAAGHGPQPQASPSASRYRSTSSAAMQPEPAAVMACRHFLSCTSPAANTPGGWTAQGAESMDSHCGRRQRQLAQQLGSSGGSGRLYRGRRRHWPQAVAPLSHLARLWRYCQAPSQCSHPHPARPGHSGHVRQQGERSSWAGGCCAPPPASAVRRWRRRLGPPTLLPGFTCPSRNLVAGSWPMAKKRPAQGRSVTSPGRVGGQADVHTDSAMHAGSGEHGRARRSTAATWAASHFGPPVLTFLILTPPSRPFSLP